MARGRNSFEECALHSLDHSGEHSDQGSIFAETQQDARSKKKISGHSDQLLPHAFEAVFAVLVILAGDTMFVKNRSGDVETISKTLSLIKEMLVQDLRYILSDEQQSTF